tara:strand:+ start:102 stop:608 length:507 start_codon:yes stop_codon:yes gene_type:complete
MKTFKELKQKIFESGEHTFGGGFGDTFVTTRGNSAVKAYGKGVFELDKEDNIDRVNAFLKTYYSKPIDDYQTQLGVLKSKLNLLGIDFDYDRNTQVQKGSNSFELKRFGGSFGKSPTTPHDEFERTNGFPEGQSYKLNMNIGIGDSGLYDIDAQISRQADVDNGDTES